MRKFFSILLLVSLTLGCQPVTVTAPVQPTGTPTLESPEVRGDLTADLVFYNGVLLTMDPDHPQAQAIAIRGDRILAVGSDEDISMQVGPDTQVIDLQGQTLLPGLADGHAHMFWVPPDKTLDDVQDLVLSYGYTSITEMTSNADHLERLLQAEADGRMRVRVNAFVTYNNTFPAEDRSDWLIAYWFPGNDPILDPDRMVRVPGVKFFSDEARCPALRDPWPEGYFEEQYFQENCESAYGDSYWPDLNVLNQAVADAQAAGYSAAIHAFGDRGIDNALDAIDFALAGQSNLIYRHQIQHSSYLSGDQVQRYVDMDMLTSLRGYFNTCEQDFYHTHAVANRYALPGLGVHAYLETDTSWVQDLALILDETNSRTINPMVQLWGLVTHKQSSQDGTTCTPEPWLAEKVITVEQALRIMTYEPIFAVKQEEVLGSLEPGKYADLVILSGNPLTVDPEQLKDLEVWMTMVGGRVEYCASHHEGFCPDPYPRRPFPDESSGTKKEFTPEPSLEPVTIKLFKKEQVVPDGTPIQLTIGWATDTEEQVADFLEAISLSGTLDGQPLTDLDAYWGEIEPFESNYGDQEGYLSNWLYPLGVLNPGTHTVEVLGSLDQPVTDGYDSNNDGQPDEYSGEVWQFTLRIKVEQ